MSVDFSRRRFNAGLAQCCAWLAAFAPAQVRAANGVAKDVPATDTLAERAKAVTGGAPVRDGRVHIDTPRLADNGHSVPITVRVESTMTAAAYVRRIALISESNPRALIATFHLTPKSGRAEIATRIRLNKTQRVLALAELSDGSFWSSSAEVVVTESACLDAE